MKAPRTTALVLVAAAIALAGCGGSDDDDGGGSGGDSSGSANDRLFSSSGFGEALDAASSEAGDGAEVVSIDVTGDGAEFSLLEGEQPKGLIYTNGQLTELELDVVGTGPADSSFPIGDVDAGAVDAMIAGVATASGASGLEIVGLNLEAGPDGTPTWTITARAGAGETLTYQADADGSNLVAADDAARGQPGAGSGAVPDEPVAPVTPGTPNAPSVEDAQAALECVQAAEGDPEQLQECVKLVQ